MGRLVGWLVEASMREAGRKVGGGSVGGMDRSGWVSGWVGRFAWLAGSWVGRSVDRQASVGSRGGRRV